MHPRTFAGLMELYERNYILLKLLFDDHDPGVIRAVHYPDRQHRLESALLERGRYTTTVRLTYSLLDRRGRPLAHPVRLKIRFYGDARQAELFHPARHLRSDAAAACGIAGKDTIAIRWALNKFLNELLVLFNRRGVRLARCTEPS